MNAEELAAKYITAMDKTVQNMQQHKGSITISEESTDEIVGYVKAYLQDAKYFMEQKKFETSLTSIAYCEGLMDALKLIGAVKIEPAP
jgi:hypothetical protein